MNLWARYGTHPSTRLLLAGAALHECFTFPVEDDVKEAKSAQAYDNSDRIEDSGDDRRKNATTLRFFLHVVVDCLGRVSQSVGSVASIRGHGDAKLSRYVCQSCHVPHRQLGANVDDGRVDFYY